jgi:hypothetical protein
MDRINTDTDLKEIAYEDAVWMNLGLDRDQWQILVNILTNFWVP